MKVTLATVSARSRAKSSATDILTADFLTRAAHFLRTEAATYPNEAALFEALDRAATRTPAHLILLDSRGKLLSSEDFAAHLGTLRDSGTQRLVLAIGPAGGWSDEARARAHLLFALGRITLPHELARAVLAEQLYRALTILAGHPYHTGH